MNPNSEVTLQINLCAGDLAYAELTVPALIATHRADVREVLVIADACRPQATPVLHANTRFPAREFSERIARLRQLCHRWHTEGLVDRVEWIEPSAMWIRSLNARYCGRATAWTHDHLGHAFTAYFAGWECARTRFVLHLDADVIVHQAAGFSWARTAVNLLRSVPGMLAVSPRIAPPRTDSGEEMVDLNQSGNGWQKTWSLHAEAHGWRSDWFSTRCHLMDRERLAKLLPLRGNWADAGSDAINRILFPLYALRQWITHAPVRGVRWLADRIARRITARVIPPFPLPPEVLLHERARAEGVSCFYLRDPRAWYIHPDSKPPELVALLPRIIGSVQAGIVPAAQRGFTGIRTADWDPARS